MLILYVILMAISTAFVDKLLGIDFTQYHFCQELVHKTIYIMYGIVISFLVSKD